MLKRNLGEMVLSSSHNICFGLKKKQENEKGITVPYLGPG